MRAALVLCALAAVASADGKPIAGSWSGEIEVPGTPLAIAITFDGGAAGLIDIPQQHATGIALAKVDVTGTHVVFELTVAGAKFEGELAGDAIKGTMTQSGMAIPFHLARTAANHMFQHTTTGSVSEYEKNSPVLDPAVLDTTADWIAARTRVKSAP